MDLDKGKNHYIKDLNRFALPLLIQLVAGHFIRLADKGIVGRISTPAFNAVNLATSTLFVLAGVLGSITIVFNVRGGSKLGQKDEEGFLFEFESSIFLSLLLGMIAFVAVLFLQRWILHSFYALEGDALEQGILFFTPMSLYVLLQLLLFAFATYFKLHGQTKWILIGSTTSSLLNVGIDYLFALGSFGLPKWGVVVVGWSTVLAMALNLLFYIYLLRKKLHFCPTRFKAYFGNAINHLKASLEIMGQDVLDGTLMVIFLNAIIIRFGESVFAGYTIVMEWIGFLFLFKYIYGSAVLSLSSISRGRSDRQDLLSYPMTAMLLSIFFYVVLGMVLYRFRHFSAALLSKDIQAQQVAVEIMGYFLLAHLVSQANFIYRSGLQALEQYRFVLYTTAGAQLLSVLLMMFFYIWTDQQMAGIAMAQFVGEGLMFIGYYRKYTAEVLQGGKSE